MKKATRNKARERMASKGQGICICDVLASSGIVVEVVA